jgi:HEAT repeat protein
MLTPAQIIPLLSHDDAEVRSRARRYLVSANDPTPATADDFWAAVDKVSEEDRGPYLDRLGLVPQTELSVRRLLEELPKADPPTADSLRGTLERLDFERLKETWETIRASEAVPDDIKTHLQARLDLANEPAEGLWERMMEFARALKPELTLEQEREVDRLIEAITRHPELLRDRVLAAVADEKLRDWQELIVTDVAGAMKLSDATCALLDKLSVEEADFLWEVAGDALVHIGDERVVAAIAERWPKEDVGFRFSACEILGRIKRPESQAALVQALQGEQDLGVVGSIASALIELMPDDAPTIDTLRALARDDSSYDRTMVHLDEDLLTLAAMTGVDLPEGPEWRRKIDERRARWSMGMSNVDTAMTQMSSALGSSPVFTGPLRPVPPEFRRSAATAVAERPAAPLAARKPFRNAQPKVGRNDPCPCGSGKKHKKCCGK